jgi:hypothetical protein
MTTLSTVPEVSTLRRLPEIQAVWTTLPEVVRQWILLLSTDERFVGTIRLNQQAQLDIILKSTRGRVVHVPEVSVRDSVSSRQGRR